MPKTKTASVTIKPSRSRRQHDRIERVMGWEDYIDASGRLQRRVFVDSDGQVSQPFRAVDTLELMFRHGTISEVMKLAGENFRTQFAVGQLDALKAADMARVGNCGMLRGVPIGSRIEAARREVWDAIRSAGGIASPGGSVLWHVLGWGQSLNEWAHQRQAWSGYEISAKAAGGILVAALGVLAGK